MKRFSGVSADRPKEYFDIIYEMLEEDIFKKKALSLLEIKKNSEENILEQYSPQIDPSVLGDIKTISKKEGLPEKAISTGFNEVLKRLLKAESKHEKKAREDAKQKHEDEVKIEIAKISIGYTDGLLIQSCKNTFPENSDVKITVQLADDDVSYATQFFIGNDALVIARGFNQFQAGQGAIGNNGFEDVAEIIEKADLQAMGERGKFITFTYRSGFHFMSVVINTEHGNVKFTDSISHSSNLENVGMFEEFCKIFNKTLLPTLKIKFPGLGFFPEETAVTERVQQGEDNVCNFHAMFNNVLGVIKVKMDSMATDFAQVANASSWGIAEAKKNAAQMLGVSPESIKGDSFEDIIKNVTKDFFKDDVAKINLQKRMVVAACIHKGLGDANRIAKPANIWNFLYSDAGRDLERSYEKVAARINDLDELINADEKIKEYDKLIVDELVRIRTAIISKLRSNKDILSTSLSSALIKPITNDLELEQAIQNSILEDPRYIAVSEENSLLEKIKKEIDELNEDKIGEEKTPILVKSKMFQEGKMPRFIKAREDLELKQGILISLMQSTEESKDPDKKKEGFSAQDIRNLKGVISDLKKVVAVDVASKWSSQMVCTPDLGFTIPAGQDEQKALINYFRRRLDLVAKENQGVIAEILDMEELKSGYDAAVIFQKILDKVQNRSDKREVIARHKDILKFEEAPDGDGEEELSVKYWRGKRGLIEGHQKALRDDGENMVANILSPEYKNMRVQLAAIKEIIDGIDAIDYPSSSIPSNVVFAASADSVVNLVTCCSID